MIALEIETALEVWRAILDLLDSGTPAEGLRVIAKHNIRGLELLAAEDEADR